MNSLVKLFLENREVAALPRLSESGGLPALVSGLSAVHRAHMGAALRQSLGRPLFVICPDDTAAENMARDLASLLGEEVAAIGLRDFIFYPAEAVSRQAEQRRIRAFYALKTGSLSVAVASVSGLLQRTLPPELLERAAFVIEDGVSCPPEDAEDALLRCGYTNIFSHGSNQIKPIQSGLRSGC